MNMVQLQISAAHGVAECQQAADGVLRRLRQAAGRAGLLVSVSAAKRSKYGLLSAQITLTGDNLPSFVRAWCGTIQWICPSNLRPNHGRKNWFIGIFLLPTREALPPPARVTVQTCKAQGKGGQHVNKTQSAVRLIDAASGLNIKVQAQRSQPQNKALAWQKLASARAQRAKQNAMAHAKSCHQQHWQVVRGQPVKIFVGRDFVEKSIF